ncbi:putative holin-like toxin [Clostridium taeniosporum]|uniref:Putative holin-like toxin n=1 Tax=Clostridium taeniosporum TaxID=394958 RepID=A0A1D7XND7_9CLOT|nr:putative holin-like toxin [Clostridium taeniosporum]AOR24834.1 putative holin-like toxin [Clostridium taeniosporum]
MSNDVLMLLFISGLFLLALLTFIVLLIDEILKK